MKKHFGWLLLLLPFCNPSPASTTISTHQNDPHYNEAGFFDIHVCNWPDQPLFFMMLFSSYEYNLIQSVNVYAPDDEWIGEITKDKFRVVLKEGKPEKRVFIQRQTIKPQWKDGWYRAKIEYNNGKVFSARDFVNIKKMDIVSDTFPKENAAQIPIPEILSWSAVPGAKYYQVFLRDLWNDGKLVFQSEVLNKPEVSVPVGILEKDGIYSWKIHVRDTNGDEKLGDFNHGSLTGDIKFTTQP